LPCRLSLRESRLFRGAKGENHFRAGPYRRGRLTAAKPAARMIVEAGGSGIAIAIVSVLVLLVHCGLKELLKR
jgi:hypothetical protein